MPQALLNQLRQRRRLGAHHIIATGAGLSLVMAVAFAALAAYALNEREDDDAARVRLLARVAEDEVSSVLDTAALALDALAPTIAAELRGAPPAEPRGSRPYAGVVGSDITRIDVLDGQGRRVLLPGSVPGPLPEARVQVHHALTLADGRRYMLLAQLDPSAIVRRLDRLVPDDSSAAVLASDAGVVVAASAQAHLRPGQWLAAVQGPGQGSAAPREAQPAVQEGAHVGAGIRPGQQLVAWRQLPQRPLRVWYEHSRAQTVADWLHAMRGLAAVAAGVVALIVVGTLLALRSHRAREGVQRELEATLLHLALRGRELSNLVSSVQELIFRTDSAGRVRFLNARWHEVAGITAEAAADRPLVDLLAPGCRSGVLALFASRDERGVARGDRLTVEEAPRQGQATLTGRDGHERHLHLTVVPLREGGVLVGFAGSAIDMTERLRAEQRLKAQLAYNEQLIEASPLPLSLVDAHNRIVNVNRAWERLRGLSRKRVLGRAMTEFVSPEEAERLRARNADVLASGGTLRFETAWADPAGPARDLVLTKVALADAGGGPQVLTVITDVTEFREAERATRQARDLAEEASRAKSEFVANISHELRTPLQSILGYSELGIVRSSEYPKLSAMFGDVHQAGQRMLALVNDLLDVAKIESTVGTFHLERGDVRPWVRSVLHELLPLLSQKRLRTEVELGALPLVARVDPLRLQQVMRNVLANAIKFSPPGAVIEVRGHTTVEGEVRLAVRDRGPGIPAAEVDKIFEAFVQSSHTHAGTGGTGLGLAISRKIIDAHGGRIWAENMPDGGSCFHIHLPAVRGFGDTVPGTP